MRNIRYAYLEKEMVTDSYRETDVRTYFKLCERSGGVYKANYKLLLKFWTIFSEAEISHTAVNGTKGKVRLSYFLPDVSMAIW